jgi:hypothetical protein
MANKRYQETQNAGEKTQNAGENSRKLRANLREHPMSPQEAARTICEIHTTPGGAKDFTVLRASLRLGRRNSLPLPASPRTIRMISIRLSANFARYTT